MVFCDCSWCLSLALSVTHDSFQQLSVASPLWVTDLRSFHQKFFSSSSWESRQGLCNSLYWQLSVAAMGLYKCTSEGASSNCFILVFRGTDLWVISYCFSIEPLENFPCWQFLICDIEYGVSISLLRSMHSIKLSTFFMERVSS